MRNDIYRYILFWIEEHLCDKISIDSLVKYSGYSRRTLETGFAKNYNMSLGEYIFRRRMTRASVMIRFAGLSITEVAMLLHYSSSANFTRAFRRYFGSTPESYRRQVMWDSNKLQIPLFYMYAEFTHEKILITSTSYIYGKRLQYNDNYTSTYDNSFIEKLSPNIENLFNANAQSVWVAVTLLVPSKISERREGKVLIETVTGYMSLIEEEAVAIMPAGLYVMCKFSGTRNEYIIFSRLAYTLCLAENDWTWTGTSSFVNFKCYDNLNDRISCELYFLIED